MPDDRPLSKRLDLTYVSRPRWPGTLITPVTGVLVIAALLVTAVLTFRNEGALYSSGSMTRAHAMFGDDCSACHVADPARAGFWLASSDQACLSCHETTAAAHNVSCSMFVGRKEAVFGLSEPVVMASSCASCHVEHKGPEHRLALVGDQACIQCHADLGAKGWAVGAAPAAPAAAPGGHDAPSDPPASEEGVK